LYLYYSTKAESCQEVLGNFFIIFFRQFAQRFFAATFLCGNYGLAACARLAVLGGGGGLPSSCLGWQADYRLCVFPRMEELKCIDRGVYFGKKFFSFCVFVLLWAKQSWSSFLISDNGKIKKTKPKFRLSENLCAGV
jgi:hypothetical protein